jgi:hypothetical protein
VAGISNVIGETSSATARAVRSSGVTRRSPFSIRRMPTRYLTRLRTF